MRPILLVVLVLAHVVLVLASIVPGRVENDDMGATTRGPYNVRDIDYAMARCDAFYSCAGLSYIKDSSMSFYKVYVHNRIEEILVQDSDDDWKTFISASPFVYGALLEKSNDIIINTLQTVSDKSTITQAETACSSVLRDCIGFLVIRNVSSDAVFENEIRRRTNINIYQEFRPEKDTIVFDIKFITSGTSNSTSTKVYHQIVNEDQLESVDSILALRHNQGTILPVYQDFLDPTGFCCHPPETGHDLWTVPLIKRHESPNLERVPCDSLSRNTFEELYEKQRTPVILTSCHTNWTAKTEWTPSKFEKRFKNSTVFRAFRSRRNTPELNYDAFEKPYRWEDILASNSDDSSDISFYISQRIKTEDALLSEFHTPEVFPSYETSMMNEIPAAFKDYYPYHFLYYGASNSSSPLHTDFVATDAWNTLLSGKKWWILIPSSKNFKLEDYRCDKRCSTSIKGDAWFASIGQYVKSFKFENGKEAMHVLQDAGETLYVPNEYMHTTYGMEESIAVSAGFVSHFERFWKYVRRNAPLTVQQRLYYTILNKDQRRIVRETHSLVSLREVPYQNDDVNLG